MARASVLVLGLAACGRVGFDIEPDLARCIPSGEEVCNGVDDDCDLAIDEGCPCQEQMLQFPISQAYTPAIAWSGSGYGIVWTEYGAGAWFSYVDAAGASPPVRLPGPPRSEAGDIVWTGDRFLAVWLEFPPGGSATITSIGLHPDGTLDGAPNVIGFGFDPSLVSLGNGYAIVHSTEHQQLDVATIDRRGALVRSMPITDLGAFWSLRAASTAPQLGALWIANLFQPSQLSFQAFDLDGSALGEPVPVASATFQEGHAIAPAGDAYGILWTEPAGANTKDMFFARVDAGGMIAPATPIVTDAQLGIAQSDLVWTGKHFLGVWNYYEPAGSEYRTVLAQLDSSGARLAPDRYLKTDLFSVPHPRLAIADGRIGLVWPVSSDGDALTYLRFAQFCY